MIGSIARALLGTPNDRRVKAYEKRVKAVNARAEEMKALDDAALQAKTVEFRTRIAEGEKLDSLLPEAFAVVREAADRVLGLRPFDVQLVGGMALHDGQIAEMKTGEGKTLVATMPVYLNALGGKGVHVVTVNDYLAKRDADWMGQLYRWLGLSVGCIVHGLQPTERREAYAADVTYGTNNEFGFDYLRDNMAFRLEDMVQRDFNYAIVDEVDSILIDEARTPLIISGPTQDTSQLYKAIETIMPKLAEGDYDLDEKQRAVSFTEEGQVRMEELLSEAGMLGDGGLYDLQNIHILHHLTQALRAHTLFQRDRDYVVKDGKVVIVDEFTGRMMEGRRYSEGLHQALEAKEDVTIQRENQTLASVTYQNYFRLYPKLAGMTGTALTEAGEFAEIYSLEVVEIPTNVAVAREDYDDEVYRTRDEKVAAILETIKQAHEDRQPVLVGTVSVEKSELLASNLKKAKIPHELLNARNHAREAQIIALAGEPGGVTIATNMAGRGTDIQLGGNLDMRIARETADIEDEEKRLAKIEEIKADIAAKREIVKAAGGLLVIGTERHESRRIDNQLRGRSGRQGDPGASRFFLSLEDDLMRIFAGDKLEGMLKRLGLEDGEAIQHPWVNKALENAQKKVEARNFEIRKNLLKFDNVMNDQRTVIYDQRRELMETEDVSETVEEFRHEVIANMVVQAIPEHSYAEQWDISGLKTKVREVLALDLPLEEWAAEEGIAEPEIEERVREASDKKIAAKRATYGEDVWRQVEKSLMLQILDRSWKDHLLALDQLRQGISLRAYAQRDPLREYQTEAFEMFQALLDHLKGEVTRFLSTIELRVENSDPAASLGRAFGGQANPQDLRESRRDPTLPADAQVDAGGGQAGQAGGQTVLRRQAQEVDPDDPNTWGRVPRNAPCPCGSGKKFKHCHGAVG